MSLIGTPPAGAGIPGTPPMYWALKVLRTKTLSPAAKMSFISSLRSLNDCIEPRCAILAPSIPCGTPGGRSCDCSLAKYWSSWSSFSSIQSCSTVRTMLRLRCSSPMMVASPFCAAGLMPGGLRQHVLGVSDSPHEHRQERKRELRMAFEDPSEMPTLDPERGRRLDGPDGRRTWELVEERHLAEDLAGSKRRELRFLAASILDHVDLPGANDERADAGVALAHDLVAGLVTLLHRSIRDRFERALIEVLEHGDALQKVDARGHGGDASRYSRSMPGFRVAVAKDIAACALTVPMQEETWSGDVIVPPQLMLAVVHNGGFVALGYAEGDDRPAGFVF